MVDSGREANDSQVGHPERRRFPRRLLPEVPTIAGITMGTESVRVVNVSEVGVLIESAQRLRPGAKGLLDIQHVDGPRRVRGLVCRSEVAGLEGAAVRYRIAIAFDTPLDWLDHTAASQVPAIDPLFANFGLLPLVVEPAGDDQEQHVAVNEW
jgi:hypothetical protein